MQIKQETIFHTLIVRSEMKSTSKLFGVPSEYFVAFFILLRSYYEEPSRTPKEWQCIIYLFFENFILVIDDQKLIRYKYVGDPN